MKTIKLGNLNGYTGGSFHGMVYDSDGLAPTLNSMQGGGTQPMIIEYEVIKLGFMDNGTGEHQSNQVFDENGLSPAITTVDGGGTQQIKILVRDDSSR